MTNWIILPDVSVRNTGKYNLANIKTCLEKFKDTDIITVSGNGLLLSTLKKKFNISLYFQ